MLSMMIIFITRANQSINRLKCLSTLSNYRIPRKRIMMRSHSTVSTARGRPTTTGQCRYSIQRRDWHAPMKNTRQEGATSAAIVPILSFKTHGNTWARSTLFRGRRISACLRICQRIRSHLDGVRSRSGGYNEGR